MTSKTSNKGDDRHGHEAYQIEEKHEGCGLEMWRIPASKEYNPHDEDYIGCTICREWVRPATSDN